MAANYHIDINGNVTKTSDEKKKKKKKQSADYHIDINGNVTNLSDADIGPVEEKKSWFRSGEFEDGYQFGDLTKTILGSAGDLLEDAGAGILGMGEKAADFLLYAAPLVAEGQYYQNGGVYQPQEVQKLNQAYFDAGKKGNAEIIAKDLYNEEEIAKAIVSKPIQKTTGFDIEKASVFGTKADSLAQSGGQLLGTAGLQMVGVPWWLTTGATSFGSEAENALNQNATYEEAGLSATITAGAEILTEKLSGGISFGGKTLDDALTQQLATRISNKVVRNGLKIGMDFVGEGSEEVVSSVFSNLGSSLYKEESIEELLTSEEAIDEYIDSFIGGGILGGVSSTGKAVKSEAKGVDYVSGLTKNEKAVFDKVYNDAIAELEADGKKLTQSERTRLYDSTMNALEKGYIDIDTIESVVGGDTYSSWKVTADQETKTQKEYDELYQMKNGEKSDAQIERQADLKKFLEDNATKKTQLREKLDGIVSEFVQGSRLSESYNEQARKEQKFEADLSQYTNESAKQTVKNFMEHTKSNNTNRAHDYLDFLTRISEDRGYVFDFTTTEQLQESIENGNPHGIEVDPERVEAFVSEKKKTIVINMSAKKSLNSLVGHEVVHTLEGFGEYDGLQEAVFKLAQTRGEFADRLASIQRRYKGMSEDGQKKELTSDLLGDYLFTDYDFIKNLSTEKPNIFKRVYNEIKYLCKMATTGSRELRELERVKHQFEKIWRESSEENAHNDSDVKFSIRTEAPPKETGIAYKVFYVKDGKLYPPMVANPDGADTPVGVWLDADVGASAPPSKTGRQQVKAGGKGTQGGSGSLAFRPGWHLGDLPRASQFDRVNPETGNKELFPENFVWAEVEYAKDVDYQEEAMSYGYTDNGKFRHAYAGLPRLPENGYYRYRTNPKPDTVPWIITGAMKVNRLLSDAEVNAILEKNGVAPVHRQGGDVGLDKFGFNEDGSVKYSISDSKGRQLSKGQQEYFKNSKARDNDGNLMVVYHGSQDHGFTVFDNGKSDDNMSFFFTNSEDMANSYVGDKSKLYEVYLNLENPYIVDAKGHRWNQIRLGENTDAITGKVERFVDLSMRYDVEIDFALVSESLGNVSDSVEYMLQNEMENLDDGEESLYSDAEKAELRQLASEIDEAYENWDEEAHLDEDGEPMSMSVYLLDHKLSTKYTTRQIAKIAKNQGHDGVIIENVYDNGKFTDVTHIHGFGNVYIAFDSNQIKTVDNANPTKDADIRYSLSDSEGRDLSAEQQEYFKNAKTRDEHGRLKPYYHGTGRADRVGNVFLPERATSGPMAFFTDSKTIADNYARDKQDTSLAYDEMYRDYYTQFRVEVDGQNLSVSEAWDKLPTSKRVEIRNKAHHITFDDDMENIIYDENAQRGTGGFDKYRINEHKGNYLSALTGEWLEDGTLYGQEEEFLKVLSLVGLDNVQYMNPDARNEKTYQVYLNVTNPFVTTDISKEMLQAFKDAAAEAEITVGNTADMWDKRNFRPEAWIEKLEADIANGTSYSWTSIPDFVTDTLKAHGYDGIFDEGGKNGGAGHQVVIPFYSEQIKNIDNESPTTDSHIDMSLSDGNEHPVEYGTYNVYSKDIALQQDIAPVAEPVQEQPVQNYGPLTEDQANERDTEQIEQSYFIDEDGLPVREEEYNGTYAEHVKPADPFYEKDIWEVGKDRKVKAYMYENPEVKPFFQQEARYMLGELDNSVKGEKFYNDQLYYDTNGEMGFFGTTRQTSDDIAYLLDTFNYTYKQIAKGLNDIIEDNGKENNAVSKRIEFLLDERLRNGYKDFPFGDKIPPNQEYINLLNAKQITEYNDEAWNNWLRGLSEDDIKQYFTAPEQAAPPQEDIAPVGVAPEPALYEAQPKKGVTEGQLSMFEEAEQPTTHLDRVLKRIDNRLEREKAELAEEFRQKKVDMQKQLKDKDTFFSNKAAELFDELSNLKKGVRASSQLGYLLDYGYGWNPIKTALQNIKYHPGSPVNDVFAPENVAREMLEKEYENSLYDLDGLDTEYQKQIEELEANAEKERANARKEEQTVTRKELHENIVGNIRSEFAVKGYDLDDVLNSAKNLSTFATVDNTPQRVMEKALGYKQGQILSDLTVNRVAQNETEGTKWLSSFTDRKHGLLAQISKQYGIKPGSKESAAAQMYAEGFYVDENDSLIAYGDAELAKDFPNRRVQANIKGLAADGRIRQIYDETLRMINESRTRNAYPEIPRLENYFLHFRAMDDTFSRLGLPFNPNDIRAKDLPTDLNGVTADLKPGQPYFASAMHRTGKRTSFDLLGGLERYLTSAKNQIYHIDDIQTLRALRNYIADTYGQAHGLESLDTLNEEEAQERIKEVYGSHLSTFAKFLNEEANILAGKTALIDRGLEGIIGRRGITFLDTVNRQVGSNMVGFNLSSSMTNFLPVVQTIAKSNKADFIKAFAQTASNKISSIFGRNDGFAEQSPVMIRRKGADRFYRTPWQKAGDAGYAIMGAVDSISTELIARTKYNELTRKGMDAQKAHYETDKWVSRLMGDRSLGQQPQLYNSKMLGLITKFQLEVRNQLDSQFYDTIQEAKASNEDIQNGLARNAKTAAKVASTFAQLAVVQHLFGKAFESVAGYNPAFDIIEVLLTAFGYDDDEESEDTVLDNIEQGFLALLEDLPYTGTLTGGRIPIASALPVEQFITGKDDYGNEKSRLETLKEVAPYYALPTGYGQIKKTYQGLSMFDDDLPIAGSYTDSGNLRFPVEDTLQNRVQAGVFGQWSSDVARDYFDNERNPLKEKQIEELVDLDIPIREYWDYREGLAKQETLEDKFDYIADLDVSVEQKNIMINNVVDRKEPVDMANYDDFADYEEFDFYTKNTEKYNFLEANGVSYAEYMADKERKEDYDNAYSWYKNNPEKVTVSKAITDNVIEYRRFTSELNDIRADKDSDGDSIAGSAKEKKIAYINGLGLDYGQKIILFRTYYDGKADKEAYNADIVEYLNSRDDISYEEMVTILEELDMKVHSDGTVSW